MKNKIALMLEAIFMYLAQAPYLVALILLLFTDSEIIGGFLLAGLIANLAILPFSFVALIFAVLGIFKEEKNPIKTTMVVKLILIPWYIINFILGVLLVTAMLNPFLYLGIPFVIFIMIFTTYIFMITTNLANYSYMIHKLIRREWKISKLLIVSIIFSLIFCLDILGAILLNGFDNRA